MNRTTKNAPFGTDNTPTLEVKIVGGKRVEVLAKRHSNEKNDIWKVGHSPPRGPHGTPSMLTQPIFRDYEYADLQKGYNTAKQHEVAREITSYTSPFGDRTRSFRHGIPAINKHPVLPPIGVSQPPGSEFISDVVSKEELRLGHEDSNDAALETIISQKLAGFPSHKIKDMYIELTSFDRHMTGYISEAQLSLVFLRHDVPLNLSFIKILMKKFADPVKSNEIKYEELLQFLISCLAHRGSGLNRSEAKTVVSDRSPAMNEHHRSSMNSKLPSPDRQSANADADITHAVDEKLVSLLKEQLVGCNEINIEELRKALLSADRLGTGEVEASVIIQACVDQRLPLTSSVLTKMLQHAEIAKGMVNWSQFLSLLYAADNQLNHRQGDFQCPDPLSRENFATSARTQQSGGISRLESSLDDRKSEPYKTPVSVKSAAYAENDRAFSSSKVTSKKQLSAGWDEREHRPNQNLKKTTSQKDQENSPRRDEDWLRKFTRLTLALRSYHPFKSDTLPRSEVERMVTNYNLIYGLGFSQSSLEEAVSRAVTSKDKKEQQQTVSVDHLLGLLSGVALT